MRISWELIILEFFLTSYLIIQSITKSIVSASKMKNYVSFLTSSSTLPWSCISFFISHLNWQLVSLIYISFPSSCIASLFKIIFPPILLRGNWHITVYLFMVYNIMIWCVYILWNCYHNKFVNICHLTVIYIFLMIRTSKVYFLSNCQIFNSILLSMATRLYITSLEFV